MSLREKLKKGSHGNHGKILSDFGVLANPFPTSNQTYGNPHYEIDQDDEAENRIATFFRDARSEVLVVVGTQGVGKTNFLNYLENQILDAKSDFEDYFIVRYMADPEPTFDATVRVIFQELGTAHLRRVGEALKTRPERLKLVKSFDLRHALTALSQDPSDDEVLRLLMEWLLGFRLLNAHRSALGVSFRLDTIESRTAVLRDYVILSADLGLLKGIFLLLDELEKQAGVLGPTAVVRYLSSMRAIIDALPHHLFLIVAVTPDAMRRYSAALPAFRSRLENQILLPPLETLSEAKALAEFYIQEAKKTAARLSEAKAKKGSKPLVNEIEMKNAFYSAQKISERRGDQGVRQREFLNTLHTIAEEKLQAAGS